MKVTSWNVNSVRTRLDHVTQWLRAHPVDVLCLQETKVVDQDFPQEPFTELGYHLQIFGQKAYNGVALISREPLSDVRLGFAGWVDDPAATEFDQQKRVISGVLNGVRIVNLYVPNGSAIGSDKYDYKLRWLAMLKTYLQTLQHQPEPINICGDFNIALDDLDIHDPSKRATHIMSSDAERAALQATVLDLGFQDAFRKFHPDGGHFSWWDYRAASFQRNRGWRIDHHYLAPDLYDRATACTIDVEPRRLEKPSDHAPVTVEYP